MHLLARVRLMVARHPWTYWFVIAVVAGVVAVSAAAAIASVDTARRSWGAQATVWTTTSALSPGEAMAVAARQVPVAVVPAGAVTHSPAGTVARQRLGPGEIVTIDDVAASGPAGLVPPGWVAFAVAASPDHFSTGDHVEVYSADQLVADGLVVDDGDPQMMIAIPTAAASTMAAALLADAVTLALTPGP